MRRLCRAGYGARLVRAERVGSDKLSHRPLIPQESHGPLNPFAELRHHRNRGRSLRVASFAMDPVARSQYLRFALDELSTRNGQFELEAHCQRLIRGRVASNLVAATGPVAAKGDEGRSSASL